MTTTVTLYTNRDLHSVIALNTVRCLQLTRTTMKILLILMSLGYLAHGARILAVLPFPSKSHSIMHYTIFNLMAQRGHEVVVYSVYPPPYSIANLTYTHLPSGLSEMTNSWTLELFHEIAGSTNFYGCTALGVFALTTAACEDVFKNENIKELLESDQHFDLIFFEFTFGQESLSVFSHKFKAPIINFQGFTTWSLIDWVAGNSLSISHIPEASSFSFTNKMTFKERLQNFLSTVLTFLSYHFEHLPNQQRLVEQYYKDPSMPHVSQMLKEISITFINSQKSLEYPRPYTPNMIPIGGAHISTHMTPLPKDIKTFVDNAKQGLIFFSLGTFVPEHNMPSKYIQAFVNAFKRLPQKVLWKTGIENIPGLPENVKLSKWVPQPTVLGHPNCVLFLTHGGLFSQHETFYAGVPVVGIPFFTEQRFNMKFYESLGVGIKLELNDVTEEAVYKAITTILNNPSYQENAKRVSSIVRDQPMSPADTVVFWVEYVLRHGGAPHLKLASVYRR
ncbi:UDP-glycosyltransferase UGT5-like isoform X3 [Homalodisca vitripennis]|uniref:UDP-glycosyltransferase UGT5-like isoform X3 n=1 Tax=Homalodisca vitripennis TaxID=197043 RepID=UPI001EEADF3B|nr:UDP-glycosyltransferase UGT5-like isoform X3 [Homalodisca vitripennis]